MPPEDNKVEDGKEANLEEIYSYFSNLLTNGSKISLNFDSSKESAKGTNDIIKSANNKFLLDVLSPEIKRNEDKKRKHKDELLRAVEVFLGVQFMVLFIIAGMSLFFIFYYHGCNRPFADSTLEIIFKFIEICTAAVVVELIAVLKYIVENVFDTSISGLVQLFREDGKKDDEKK